MHPAGTAHHSLSLSLKWVSNKALSYSTGSDTSGFVSSANSVSTTQYSPSNVSSPGLSPTPPQSGRSSMPKESQIYPISRRASSGQKLATRLINALTPCRGQLPRRSRSLSCVSRKGKENITVAPLSTGMASVRSYPWEKSNTGGRQYGSSPTVIDALASRTVLTKSASALSGLLYSSNLEQQMDTDLLSSTPELWEFRRRWPATFLTLVTNYLGFLIFSTEEVEEIRDALVKEAKHTLPQIVGNSEDGVNTKPKSSRWVEVKRRDKDLDHWYIVVSTTLHYLLENERFKKRFILRRPAVTSSVNELERILFPPRHHALSVASARSRYGFGASNTDCSINQCPTTETEVIEVLQRYDTSVVASILTRVLRRQGYGLIPTHLRRLFLQLVSGVKENALRQRRAVRLFFTLFPRDLATKVFQPLFRLLACIASEPECEVDETSLSLLLSPIFFMDKQTATPASLVNPMPAKVVLLLVTWASSELHSHKQGDCVGVDRLFQLPYPFVNDCYRNLKAYSQSKELPPLMCSLKYCVTMTPSPRSRGKADVEPKLRDQQTQNGHAGNTPTKNLTATFLAKRPRQLSPFRSKDGATTPVLKTALHAPMLDFRVRRTPVQGARQHCFSTQSPTPSLARLNGFLLPG